MTIQRQAIDRKKMRDQLIHHEALRLKPYRDSVGKLTLGVGRNIEDNGITATEAMFLLDNDIRRCEAELDEHCPWWREMTEARQRVLLDMCFNLGWTRLAGFVHTLAAMKMGEYSKAADHMIDSRWAKQVGPRANRLAGMMERGV